MATDPEKQLESELNESRKKAEYVSQAWQSVTAGLVFFVISVIVLWPIFTWRYYHENPFVALTGSLIAFGWIFISYQAGDYIAEWHNKPIRDRISPDGR